MRACRGDFDFSDSGRDGSSRRNARYMDLSFVGVAILRIDDVLSLIVLGYGEKT